MANKHLSDDQFKEAFESGKIASHDFKHVDHIRMAWIYLTRAPIERALIQITEGIRRFAAVHGATQLYHETITLFWIYAVQTSIQKTTAISFAEFLQKNSFLAEKGHIYSYYSKELLMSPEAKKKWIEPDLLPIEQMRSRAS
jgi:hypothetical protein